MTDSTDNARGPELLPCPFCGGTDLEFSEYMTDGGPRENVKCEDCSAELGGWKRPGAAIIAWNRRADLAPDPLGVVKVKPLVWDGDNFAATQWGGYSITDRAGPDGEYDHFGWYHSSRADSDHSDDTWPAPEAARAAAQADYETRIRSALEPCDPLADPRVVALVEALKQAEQNFYEAANRFRDEDYEGPISGLTVDAVCHAKPYFDKHMQYLDDSAAETRAALAALSPTGGNDE